MFFLIRCVFWLWVVFSTIFAQSAADGGATQGAPAPKQSAAAQPVVHVAQAWLAAAAARVADKCAAAPETCLSVAAQFSKLAANREAAVPANAEPAMSLRPTLSDIHFENTPLPPRRPDFRPLGKAKPVLEKTGRREYLMDRARAEAAL